MNFEEIFKLFTIPLFIHSALIFCQSIKVGPSQYNSLLTINIDGLQNSLKASEILDHSINDNCNCKKLFSSILIWSKRLRILGIIPIILYLFMTQLYFFGFVLQDKIDLKFIMQLFWGIACSLQIIYVYIKLQSNIPSILLELHKDYKSSNFMSILFDISPILKK